MSVYMVMGGFFCSGLSMFFAIWRVVTFWDADRNTIEVTRQQVRKVSGELRDQLEEYGSE